MTYGRIHGNEFARAFSSGVANGLWTFELGITGGRKKVPQRRSQTGSPEAHPVPKIALDGRLMEGTTYLEHSVLGVSLDSGLMEGTSSPEPLEQSVLNTLLVA